CRYCAGPSVRPKKRQLPAAWPITSPSSVTCPQGPDNRRARPYVAAMSELAVSVLPAISGIKAPEWDGCGAGTNPFTTHRFLSALAQSGSVGEGTGWHPAHLVARLDGRVAGVAPCYIKTHSQGEYIFDHGWAQAYERAGGR